MKTAAEWAAEYWGGSPDPELTTVKFVKQIRQEVFLEIRKICDARLDDEWVYAPHPSDFGRWLRSLEEHA